MDPKSYYPPSPQCVPSYDSEVAPALTETLVPAPEQECNDAVQENKDTEQENNDEVQENKDAVQEEDAEQEEEEAEDKDEETDINEIIGTLSADYV